MNTFFTSDEHYGHKNIINYSSRPFPGIEVMEEQLIARHNRRVAFTDTVYHLGDFSLDEKLVSRVMSQLRGRHILVPGNHDKCHPVHKKKRVDFTQYVRWGFDDVLPLQTTKHFPGLGEVLLCHMPYPGEHNKVHDTYAAFRPENQGMKLLHGHVHELWKKKGDLMLNVGVDQWDYAPVSLDEVIEAFK